MTSLISFLEEHALIYDGYFTAKDIVQSFSKKLKSTTITMPIESLLRSITGIKDYDEEEFMQKLIELVQKLHNHTRLWINRGYTPEELSSADGVNLDNIRLF